MSARRIMCAGIACAGLWLGTAPARADDMFTKIEADPTSEFWIDSGFAHGPLRPRQEPQRRQPRPGRRIPFFRHAGRDGWPLRQQRPRLLELRRRDLAAVCAGAVRLGAAIAAFDGYPKMRDGGWFPALIPTFTYEYKRVGVNVGVIPTYKDRLYGGISVQLKIKLF